MTPRSETEVSKAIGDFLDIHPRVSWQVRVNSGRVQLAKGGWMHLAPKDTPDRIGMLKGGRFFAVEVKRDAKTKPTNGQVRRLNQINADGGLAFVAHSIACVERYLGEIG